MLLKHPSLLLSLPAGEVSTAKAHMELELKRAPDLYERCVAMRLGLLDIVAAFQRKICYFNSYLYPMCRKLMPQIAVETGVHWGNSTAFVLQALEDNGHGHLWSIDLPNVAADPQNVTILSEGMETGFLVPETLKSRWTLILGDARVELPRLLTNFDSLDLFHHDSLHTYEHMRFEYEEVWPKLRIGGFIVSDDVTRNHAFEDFCDDVGASAKIVSGKGIVSKSQGPWEYKFESVSTS